MWKANPPSGFMIKAVSIGDRVLAWLLGRSVALNELFKRMQHLHSCCKMGLVLGVWCIPIILTPGG